MYTTILRDLTIGVLGIQVPQGSGTIKWSDGHKTVLPAIFDENNINRCNDVDIPLIRFMARLPSSDRRSKHVEHLDSDVLTSTSTHATTTVTKCLSSNKVVRIRGVPCTPPRSQLDPDYLDEHFGISPLREVQLHGSYSCTWSIPVLFMRSIDVGQRCGDHAKPHIFATIKSFFEGMDDPSKIQCILDVPLAHISPPEQLR